MSATPTPQKPGCLPDGRDENSMLTPDEFCIWQQVKLKWFYAHRRSIPGVVAITQKHIRVHVKTHIAYAAKQTR